MTKNTPDTAARLVQEARQLIVHAGYNGFSYADLAEKLDIKKASIHHHFPSKVDLVIAAVEQARAVIQAQTAMLANEELRAVDQLLAYTTYWQECIRDQTAPFCIAGVLAAEMPGLPPEIADSVRGHFTELRDWMTRVLTLGVAQRSIRLERSPALEAETFMAAVYGAMLAARAFDDPTRFDEIVGAFLARIGVSTEAPRARGATARARRHPSPRR